MRASGKLMFMRPVRFREALAAGTRLTLFSDDKPDRFFTIIKSWRMKRRALRSQSEVAFLPIKSKTRNAKLIC
jgi:hypothetical protein